MRLTWGFTLFPQVDLGGQITPLAALFGLELREKRSAEKDERPREGRNVAGERKACDPSRLYHTWAYTSHAT